jgi:hypothetical protein
MNKEYVAKVLKDRLENRDTQFLYLDMKNGDKIQIDDCFGYYVYFSKIGKCTRAEDFDDLVDIVMNHPAKQNEVLAEEQRWFNENEPKVKAFFKEHFEGKTWEEIRNDEELYDDWSWYSDYHKDVYGYRPHGIVCGEYINPHAR